MLLNDTENSQFALRIAVTVIDGEAIPLPSGLAVPTRAPSWRSAALPPEIDMSLAAVGFRVREVRQSGRVAGLKAELPDRGHEAAWSSIWVEGV